MKVLIIGAGVGGLCLAQGLKQDGIEVEAFERDHTPTDRLQGYRLSLRADGGRALKACLPAALFARLDAAAGAPSRNVSFLDCRLRRLLVLDVSPMDPASPERERPIGRVALRRILLDGLGDIVRFGKRFVAFEDAPDGRVIARFEDGSSAIGDVLVGADGAGSHLRGQLLPEATRVETGVVVIAGKFGAAANERADAPPAVWNGPTLILGPPGRFLFASGIEGTSGADAPARDRDGYVMWGFSAWRALFTRSDVETLDGRALKREALSQVADWDPALRRLIERTDPAEVHSFPIRTSRPVAPWPTRNVTLLGDALHNMTPYRGVGANTALKDALALRGALAAVARGERGLIPALAAYERDMIDGGFRAVAASLAQMERMHARGAFARAAVRMLFRAADRIPALRNALFAE